MLKEELSALVDQVAGEWQMGGIGSDTLYGELAVAVAWRARLPLLDELATLRAERDALRALLFEADRIMGHDDTETDWRERCAAALAHKGE